MPAISIRASNIFTAFRICLSGFAKRYFFRGYGKRIKIMPLHLMANRRLAA